MVAAACTTLKVVPSFILLTAHQTFEIEASIAVSLAMYHSRHILCIRCLLSLDLFVLP